MTSNGISTISERPANPEQPGSQNTTYTVIKNLQAFLT